MSIKQNPFKYPVNPDFGQGVYRRRIRLENFSHYTLGDLEDCNHAFRVRIEHDGKTVSRVMGEAVRTPFDTCPGAIEPLQKLQGLTLGLSSSEILKHIDGKANCTHWLDLAMLAIAHAGRSEKQRQYDIAVPDEVDNQATAASIVCNGKPVLQWQISNWQMVEPLELAGQSLFKGFARWASQLSANNDIVEAAFALQKGYFVARARYYDLNALAGESAEAHATMYDACYTYSQPQRAKAIRTGKTTYDFTDCPEQLLQFR